MKPFADPPRVRLLVCGETLRRDDGAAVRAIELLADDARALADVVFEGQLSVESLVEAGDAAVVVVDAAVGVRAGVVVTMPLAAVAAGGGAVQSGAAQGGGGEAVGGSGAAAPASSHALPPAQVVALAAELRGSVPRGVFVGIGGAEFGFGEGLSPDVDAALPGYAAAISEAIRSVARASGGPE